MFSRIAQIGQVLLALSVFVTGASAQEQKWFVEKSSGEVWVVASGAQPVALNSRTVLVPGDQIRTGKNGRVQLVRGAESIWLSPNTAIDMPREKAGGLATTILQTSGSILVEAEKRDHNHFEVETPYLVAVVKGTQFRVSIEGQRSNVDVVNGRVEVMDLRSGQFALILPGQSASATAGSGKGLTVVGPGALDAVKQGTPRPSRAIEQNSPERISPRAIENAARGNDRASPRTNENATRGIRIDAAIGEVKLDFPKVTKGIVRASAMNSGGGRGNGAAGDSLGVGEDNALDPGRSAGLGSGGVGATGGGNSGGNGGGMGGGIAGGPAQAAGGPGNGAGVGNAFGQGGCNGKGKGASC